MNLLISNDDGVFSAGIRALAQELKNHHHVTIAAPESQRSGGSHAITCAQPVRVRKVTLPGLEDVDAYAVDGTPADCVRLGCTSLGLDVDMVVSGINHGGNLGTDVLYSGTVGAAMEGALLGKLALATSCNNHNPNDFGAASHAALWAVDYLFKNPMPMGMLLNLNAPDIAAADVKGVKLAGLCLQQYDYEHAQFTDPSGLKYFWTPSGKLTECAEGEDTDERWVREGYVTLTPIHYDIACYAYMEKMDVSGFDLSNLASRPKEN